MFDLVKTLFDCLQITLYVLTGVLNGFLISFAIGLIHKMLVKMNVISK